MQPPVRFATITKIVDQFGVALGNVIDLDRKVVPARQAAQETFGYPMSRRIGQHVRLHLLDQARRDSLDGQPPEVIAALGRGETVDPARYYFRTTPRFETGVAEYAFLNQLLAVASGDRRPGGPLYTIDELV